MPKDIVLTDADIELLREACSARGGVVRVDPGLDIQRRLRRTANAMHLAKLGYLEPIEDGWRIKPELKRQVAEVLKGRG